MLWWHYEPPDDSEKVTGKKQTKTHTHTRNKSACTQASQAPPEHNVHVRVCVVWTRAEGAYERRTLPVPVASMKTPATTAPMVAVVAAMARRYFALSLGMRMHRRSLDLACAKHE